MAPRRSYQDMDWRNPATIARELVTEMIAGHEKREVSTARFRDRKFEKDMKLKKVKETKQ